MYCVSDLEDDFEDDIEDDLEEVFEDCCRYPPLYPPLLYIYMHRKWIELILYIVIYLRICIYSYNTVIFTKIKQLGKMEQNPWN